MPIVYDAMGQVAHLPDQTREMLNHFLREHLSTFYSSPQYADLQVNPEEAYYSLYYAVIGMWVTGDITTFLELICPDISMNDETGMGYMECALDGLVCTDYPAPILVMAGNLEKELKTKTGLVGLIQTIFPGVPISYKGDDARGMVVICEHFNF